LEARIMAKNESRDLLLELRDGASDGSYRKIVRDRGGDVENTTWEERQDMAAVWFGFSEIESKNVGDGSRGITPDYQATKPWRLT
jgi:hypothetical protein